MKRVLGLLVVCIAAVGFDAAVVDAASYPPAAPVVSSSNSAPIAGSTITLTASGFCPDTTVTFTMSGSVVGTATTNAAGTASVVVTVPSVAGTVTVTASSSGTCPATTSLTLSVVQPATDIPVTGASGIAPAVRFGIIAVVLGLGLIGVASLRRRSRRLTAD